MKVWVEPRKTSATVVKRLRIAVGGHPLVAELLARRGFSDPEHARAFLDPAKYRDAPPSELPDMAHAASRISDAITKGQQICVWGDFDVDGQTATALLVSTLEDLGADVGYYVPVRESEGHGINLRGLENVIDAGATRHPDVRHGSHRA